MGVIWALLVGALIGFVAGKVVNGGGMGWIWSTIAGLVGSSLGTLLLGSWGPSLAGMALIPSVIGAIILVAVVSWLTKGK